MTSVEIPPMTLRACRALAEEHEAARAHLYGLLGRFPESAFTTGNIETEDNVRGILCHVTASIFSYACWIERVLGRLDPEVEKREKAAFLADVRAQSSADGFAEASRRGAHRFYRALSPIASEQELEREFKSNWGPTYCVEAMIEHALVHLIRHRRQIEIHLGLRPA